MLRNLIPAAFLCTAAAAEVHVLPAATGSGDGSSWANALAADSARLDQAIAALAPGDSLRLGSGEYRNLALTVANAGGEGRPIAIVGVDTGAGLPLLIGTWQASDPAKGPTLFSLKPGTRHLLIADLQVRNYQELVGIRAGGVRDCRFRNLQAREVRSGFELSGGTDAAKEESWNERLVIERCSFTNYTKRGVRFRRGNRACQVLDCVADAGGKAFATELWQTGFSLEGDRNAGKEGRAPLPDHDIRFERCIARNNHHDNGDKYWNADGFTAESGNYGVSYLDCEATGNTDGGWDDKSPGVRLVRCRSSGNKRNYRFWSPVDRPAVLEECQSGPAVKAGGSGDAAGVWIKGGLQAVRCTFAAQPKVLSVDGPAARAVFSACTFTAGERPGRLWDAGAAAQVTEEGCTRQGELQVAAGEAAPPPAAE